MSKDLAIVYKTLLEKEYKDKPIWKYLQCEEKSGVYPDDALTAAPCFCGRKYQEGGLMVVGRAVNGWEYGYNSDNVADPEIAAKTILEQRVPFDDVVDRNGMPYADGMKNKRNYFYSRSSFWRLIKKVLEESGLSEKDKWYDDKKEWNQQIVWSNLYKIAPRKSGNPPHQHMAENMSEYIDILKKEIELYKPGKILLVTDDGYYLEPESGKKASFISELGLKKIPETDRKSIIKMTGTFDNAKIVVCVRPERKNTFVMASEIVKKF